MISASRPAATAEIEACGRADLDQRAIYADDGAEQADERRVERRWRGSGPLDSLA